MSERVAVVTCVWQRPERLRYTLDGLAMQTMPCDVLLINNNAELAGLVNRAVERTDWLRVHVWQNAENRGPYARIEMMYSARKEYDWFIWLDDDVLFGDLMVGEWLKQAEPDTLKSWKGFRFTGDYWTREQAEPGEECHFLLGSNMLIPAAAVQSAGVLDLQDEYRLCCDDLWLCYYAAHVLGLRLATGRANVRIEIDGRDTYLHHHATKIRLLEELRARGWDV